MDLIITAAILFAPPLADVSLLAFTAQATGLWAIVGEAAGVPFGRVLSCCE